MFFTNGLTSGRWHWGIGRALVHFCLSLALAGLIGEQFASKAMAADLAGGSGDRTLLNLADPGQVLHLRITKGKSQTLVLNQVFAEALVASAETADVVPLTDRSLYVVGKTLGLTRITVLDKSKKLIGIIEVEVSFDIKALKRELEQNIAAGQFRISTANGRILLGGSVADSVSLAKAVEIVEQFAPATDANSPKNYVNGLSVRAAQQVLLEVRFVEAQRTAERDLGVAWDVGGANARGLSGANAPPGSTLTSAFTSVAQGFPSPSNPVPFGSFIASVLSNGTHADALIQALEQRGLARRLAEPNLVALSGDTANFLAGGEFPFPVSQTSGTAATLTSAATAPVITLEFKKFGVGLAFTPTVLADGQINLKIEPEVSDLDANNSVTLAGGITIPSLVVRKASTTVELRDGQGFAIAGLLQTKHFKNDQGLPWLGTVPVLGALFSSSSFRKEETDLVIIVTPHLVRPTTPGQKLETPFDQKLASNDRDFFLNRQMEVAKTSGQKFGHILDLEPSWAPSNNQGSDYDADK